MDNSFYNVLELGKIALFIVPHEDDEINIGGGIIPLLIKKRIKIKVVFATNGDYSTRGSRRIKESYNALKKLGVKKENIIIMGYSDQHKRENTHIYMTENNDVWKSKKGYSQTYHPLKKEEWCLHKENVHHKYNKENFINDLISIIKDIKADYIFTIDFDSHPDHRALSLCTEYALGSIFNSDKNYRPKVYKSFAYPTCYFGKKDFNSLNVKSTKFITEKYSYCDIQNPYYSWEERIRFPLLKDSITKNLLINKTVKAMKCHKSQLLINEAFSTINGDQIFWQRRTDNLLYNSNIKVTSGDKEKLRDFMLFDCKDIMKGNEKKPILESNAWIPDETDKIPEIEISFQKKQDVSLIKMYHSLNKNSTISKIEILADNNYKKIFELSKEKNNISELTTEIIQTKNIKIRILKRNDKLAGLSELEIFAPTKEEIEFIKLEINDDFAYNHIYKEEPFKVYSYNGFNSRILNNLEYNIISKTITPKKNVFKIKQRKNKIRIELKKNKNIYDEVSIKKYNLIDNIINKQKNLVNKILVKTIYTIQRINRKIKIIMKIN